MNGNGNGSGEGGCELTPFEATGRALALLTYAHAAFRANAEMSTHDLADEDILRVLACDDGGGVDWQSIALGLAMLGHVLLDLIPEKMYNGAEDALSEFIAKRDGGTGDTAAYRVSITARLSGTDLLRLLSLHVAATE
jgi:hypothetical protein